MITFRILKRDGLVVRATFGANDGEDVPLMVMRGVCPDIGPGENDGTRAWLPTALQKMETPFGNKIIKVIAPPPGTIRVYLSYGIWPQDNRYCCKYENQN